MKNSGKDFVYLSIFILVTCFSNISVSFGADSSYNKRKPNINSETNFLTFSLNDNVKDSDISLEDHTIDITVYSYAIINSTIATFSVSNGASVKVGDVTQQSGITSNDFTNPIIYKVLNGENSEEQEWVVTVKKNTVPIANEDFVTIEEDSDLTTINIIQNDIDADGDTIVITEFKTSSFYLTMQANSDGESLDFAPWKDYYGEVVIEYTISDGYESNETGILTITIQPINDDAPVARDDTFKVFKNANFTNIDVLSNDYDPDNFNGNLVDTIELIYAVTSGQGEVSITDNKSLIQYKPDENFSGTEEITYIISDGANDAVGKVIVTVNNEITELNDIYQFTISQGAGGSNSQIDFGIKSNDIFSDLLAGDMALSVNSYRWYTGIANLDATQDFSYSANRQVWLFYYNLIRRCNYLIEIIENTDETNQTAQTKAALGQTKALRAYAYFYLAQFFQDEYIEQDSILPIITKSDENYKSLSTAKEVFDFIIKDLDESISLLDGFTRSAKNQIDINIARAFKAYVLGAMGVEDELIVSLTQQIIDSNDYSITAESNLVANNSSSSANGFVNGFNDVSSPSWMWGMDVVSANNLGLVSWWGQMDAWAYSYAWAGDYKAIDASLYNQISDNDYRKNQFLDDTSNTRHLQPLFKFRSADAIGGGARPITSDYVYMRIEEIYLLNAEAHARLGNNEAAKTSLKTLVDRRVSDASYINDLSGSALQDEIYLQTRIELWGEGKAYLAMKRNKKSITRGSNHLFFAGETIPHNDNSLTFDIPEGFGYTSNDPVITLIGEENVNSKLGVSYNDLGATAVDKDNNDISDKIIVENNVNSNLEGDYIVTYTLTDSNGRLAIPILRKVKVSNSLSTNTLESLDVQVYPNPFKNSINITTKSIIKSIKIYNLVGKKLIEKNNNFNFIDLNNISKGIYILKIKTEKGTGIKKIIKS